jgi:hypothetical protein
VFLGTFVEITGVASYDATGLTPATSYCFGVRARDPSNNVSTNTQTLLADTLVSFTSNVQPIFDDLTNGCTNSACHGVTSSGGLDLRSPSYAQLFGVPSSGCPSNKRVIAFAHVNSYLWMVMANAPTSPCGLPTGFDHGTLSPADLAMLTSWIDQGASNN